MGITPVKVELQTDSMDEELRTGLWNAFHMYFPRPLRMPDGRYNAPFFHAIWLNFFKVPVEQRPKSTPDDVEVIRKWYRHCKWYEVYEFLEFIVSVDTHGDWNRFKEYCNEIMERELSGFRFIGDTIAPITNETELGSIEKAIDDTVALGLNGINQHIQSAISKLSDRKEPDYRNSIKESISAVEGVCQLISGKAKATLGDALKTVKEKLSIHPALVEGFSSIYGYTSDEGGIRHAMQEDSKCAFEDAEYMLVSCSAFVHYLLMKAEKAGIKMSV